MQRASDEADREHGLPSTTGVPPPRSRMGPIVPPRLTVAMERGVGDGRYTPGADAAAEGAIRFDVVDNEAKSEDYISYPKCTRQKSV